jgi:TrmH family RNA methyltransferase
MPLPQFRPWKGDEPYTYALGVFPALEAFAAACAIQAVILPEKPEPNEGIAALQRQAQERSIPVILGDRLLERLSGKENCLAIAVVQRQEQTLDSQCDHLVVERPSDQGNLGTILRTALGFGLHNVAIVGGGTDPDHPRVIRASMGARFHLSIARFASAQDYGAAFQRPIASLRLDGTTFLEDFSWPSPVSLVLGNEASGLSPDWNQAQHSIRIRHESSIDSLNLAIAAGIVLHEWSRCRR